MKKYLAIILLILTSERLCAQNMHTSYDYLKLFLENGINIMLFIGVIIIIITKPKFLQRITSFDAFGVKLQLKDIRESIESTQQNVMSIKKQLDAFQEEFIEQSQEFDPEAPPEDLDDLATDLKRYAAALDNIDFVLNDLKKGSVENKIFAAACAIQVRPQPKFFSPIITLISEINDSINLNGLRLKTLYRLVICVENIARADNSRPRNRIINDETRKQAVEVLSTLKKSTRAKLDSLQNGKKSIGTRIERTIKVIEYFPKS
ncbi:MAG: hypothetical protein WC384_07530 [Prolixibacteraceae bacterium]|jgi:hypothetical protein